jgi:hypothetical protein
MGKGEEPDDPGRRGFGNLVVWNTQRGIRNVGTVSPLSTAQLADCQELLSRLREQWNRMFIDKNRIEGTLMRLDQQSFFDNSGLTFSNTAIQNNTERGARGREHSHTYACVLIDVRAAREAGQIADALIYAYKQSLALSKSFQIDLISAPSSSPSSGPATEQFVCASCGNTLTLFSDAIERSRQEGWYPPRDLCPRWKTGKLMRRTTI